MSRRIAVGRPPRQVPYKRTYPGGRVVWLARYFDLDGEARYAKPRWNGAKSTFARKGDAQEAIDEALHLLHSNGPEEPAKVGSYFELWPERHPRSKRTNETNTDRISRLLDLEIEGLPLRDLTFDELRRRHVLLMVDHMLRVEGRAIQGVRGILSSFSAMAEDAIGDDLAAVNAFAGIRLRRNDSRARKAPRKVRVWSFEQMRAFARGGRAEIRAGTERPDSKWGRCYPPHDYEALLLTPAMTGLRLGEFLALQREDFDGRLLTFRFSAHEGDWSDRATKRTTSAPCRCPPASPSC